MDGLEEEVFLFIQLNQKKNGNKCGTKLTDIACDFSIDYKQVKEIVIKLYRAGKIKSREGVSNNLIFI